jgi:2-amino-4-hydroxy-6-hydroxymethyldihydropteridine diphosphokinase
MSDIIETGPLGKSDQPKYLNAVAELKTTLSAEDLYRMLAGIETSLGRVRQGKWAPRTIDLDLLLFGREIIDSPDLIVPHPQMHLRSFVLKGLCQLAGDLIHSVMKESATELARRLSGGRWPSGRASRSGSAIGVGRGLLVATRLRFRPT